MATDDLLSERLAAGPAPEPPPGDEADAAARAEDRRRVVEVLRVLIEGMYVHLPQKRASYGFDPSQRLRLLAERADELDEPVFQRNLAQIVTDLRDAHTRYLAPGRDEQHAMFLPILVERYTDDAGRTRFVASKVKGLSSTDRRRFSDAGFVDGVELTHWNAVPIERAVDIYARQETGGRPDARVARALESLTMRPLRYSMPPDEEWVDVGFRTARNSHREIRLDWRRVRLTDPSDGAPGQDAVVRAYEPIADSAREVKKMLFARSVWEREQGASLDEQQTVEECAVSWTADRSGWLAGRFAANVAARVVTHRRREYGHLRIHSFQLHDDQAFIGEVVELLAHMPRSGLIVDLRSNPGGLVWAAEGLLQLFTPNRIRPTRFSMLATDLTRAMAGARQNRHLSAWSESLDDAVTTGVSHSRSVPLTPPARCNDRGQVYGGPVVAVVDANTYSAGDLFAAGFVDNEVGKLVSTDAATGGGGANVWTDADVARALAGTPYELPDLHGAKFTMSFRRAERIGEAGVDIEDTGVTGSFHHALTHRDLTEKNRDLIAYAAGLLAAETTTALDVDATTDPTVVTVEVDGIDRIVVEVDGVPYTSVPVDGPRVELPRDPSWDQRRIDIVGYRRGTIRQRRRVDA